MMVMVMVVNDDHDDAYNVTPYIIERTDSSSYSNAPKSPSTTYTHPVSPNCLAGKIRSRWRPRDIRHLVIASPHGHGRAFVQMRAGGVLLVNLLSCGWGGDGRCTRRLAY